MWRILRQTRVCQGKSKQSNRLSAHVYLYTAHYSISSNKKQNQRRQQLHSTSILNETKRNLEHKSEQPDNDGRRKRVYELNANTLLACKNCITRSFKFVLQHSDSLVRLSRLVNLTDYS
jgi:hypothetical protein